MSGEETLKKRRGYQKECINNKKMIAYSGEENEQNRKKIVIYTIYIGYIFFMFVAVFHIVSAVVTSDRHQVYIDLYNI